MLSGYIPSGKRPPLPPQEAIAPDASYTYSAPGIKTESGPILKFDDNMELDYFLDK
jgi:hypothetical protein